MPDSAVAGRANLFQVSALLLRLTAVLPMTLNDLLQLHLSLTNTTLAPIGSHGADTPYR